MNKKYFDNFPIIMPSEVSGMFEMFEQLNNSIFNKTTIKKFFPYPINIFNIVDNKENKNAQRKHRHLRVRKKISGTKECPRLNVYRSTSHIYAQIIDDVAGNTLVACSTVEKALASEISGKSKSEIATIVGKKLGEKALAKGIKQVVFDRGGYLYIGRVKALADGAREAGLDF